MTQACKLCSGDWGTFSPNGMHYLCEALAARGLDTPCLGHRCTVCNGSGVKPGHRGGVMLGFDLHPSQIARSIKAQFPPCVACDGKGYHLGQ